MNSDNPYDALAEEHGGDGRWAYGTGFTDPMAGTDRAVPSGVDRADLAVYCLMLADDALVLAQRTAEWCSRAPELEEEMALANIALDLLGQARLLLSRAGELDPTVRPAGLPEHVPDEDALAYFRHEREFRNVRLAELENGDFARTVVRLLAFATWRLALLSRLTASRDPVLAAVAAKGVKELAYHRDHAARWVVRLGDGTEESRRRVERGLAELWPYLPELFEPHAVEVLLAGQGVAVDPTTLRAEVRSVLTQVLTAATLTEPEVVGAARVAGRAGRDGVHTEVLAHLLAELQSVARADPEAVW